MAPHLGLEKIAWLGLAKKQKLLLLFIVLKRIYPKTMDPFFRIFEKKNIKVWVKFSHIFI
jgi:hypothetical protein